MADVQEDFDFDDPMVMSGNYKMIVRYIAPDFDREVVEFIFEYHADTASELGERREATSTTDESATEYSLDGYNVNGDNFDNSTGQTASVIGGRGDNNNNNNNTNARVSIVPGSTSLIRIAYQPNPAQVSTGATVTWTNDDLQPHTVTSGENAEADGRFDSGIMAPTRTFEHTFTQPGSIYVFLHITSRYGRNSQNN